MVSQDGGLQSENPAQVTLGDGGTLLDPTYQGGALPVWPLNGVPGYEPLPAPTRGLISFSFGWTLWRPTDAIDVFNGVRYEAGGDRSATCRLARHSIDCREFCGVRFRGAPGCEWL